MDSFRFLSPFEMKDLLNHLAREGCANARKEGRVCEVIDVGRGNPNFLNTIVREAFHSWSLFCTQFATKKKDSSFLGFRPVTGKIGEKFQAFVKKNRRSKGVAFLQRAFSYAVQHFSLTEEEFLYEMCSAALGDNYPTPPCILPSIELIVEAYLKKILCFPKEAEKQPYRFFATEGATAAMIYLFHTLKMNALLSPGDEIALITPIFSPYLEIPLLQEFCLKEIFITTKEENFWQIPEEEIEKLQDPKIKALFLVDPTNPTGVTLEGKSLDRLVEIVTKRRDLIVLIDTVYAPFVNGFRSLIHEIPENVICVYSYSKYFGVTGWRLGVVMFHEKNVMDHLIAAHSVAMKEKLRQRYSTVTVDVEHFSFMDRLVADSREEALMHTGGLSTPQQCIMALFSLFDLMDEKNEYKKTVHSLLKRRRTILYKNLHLPLPRETSHTLYYVFLDLVSMAKIKYGLMFAAFLEKQKPLNFFFNLAEKKTTICLPGYGFGGPLWSLRISLANCDDEIYAQVGKNIHDLVESYYNLWKEIG